MTKGYRTPLMMACEKGQAKKVDFLLKSGVDLEDCDKSGMTALWYAITNKNAGIVKQLLDSGADVYTEDESTLLMYAVVENEKDIVQYLLDYGVDPNDQDDLGTTALMYASERNNVEILEKLLRSKADPNIRDVYGHRAIDFARQAGWDENVLILQKYETASCQ